MAKATSMTIGLPGVELWIEYTTNNKRIQTVDYTLIAGITARCRIWDTTISLTNPIYDSGYKTGAQTGSETVAGNYRMVAHPDGYDEFPSNILWTMEIIKTG